MKNMTAVGFRSRVHDMCTLSVVCMSGKYMELFSAVRWIEATITGPMYATSRTVILFSETFGSCARRSESDWDT